MKKALPSPQIPTANPPSPGVKEDELAIFAEAAARAVLGAPSSVQYQEAGEEFVTFSPGSNTGLWKAILSAQKAISNPSFDKENPHTKSGYATLGSVFAAIRKEILDAGLVLFQAGTRCSEEQLVLMVLTRLTHAETGEYLQVVSKLKMSKDDAQGFGGAFTYGKRYTNNGLFAIVGETDDDGESSSQTGNKVASKDSSDFKHIKTSGPVSRKEGQAPPPARSRGIEKEMPKDPGPLADPEEQLLNDMRQAIIRQLQDGWGGRAREVGLSICKAHFGGKKIAELNMEEVESYRTKMSELFKQEQDALALSARG